MTPSRVRRRLPHAERREEILTAAAAMFRARGYEASSIDAIAASVGISGPAIYRYFARKPDILIALIERAVASATDAIVAAAVGKDGDDLILAITDSMIAHAARDGAVISLVQSATGQMEAGDRDRLHRIRLDLVDHLSTALCRARPDLTRDAAGFHADAALGVISHVSLDLSGDAVRVAQFRRMVRAVLAA